MNQSKLESKIEVFFNYASGFVIAWFTYAFIVLPTPWLMHSPFLATSLFTVISIARTYFWRRFFNNGVHKLVHKFVGDYCSSWLKRK